MSWRWACCWSARLVCSGTGRWRGSEVAVAAHLPVPSSPPAGASSSSVGSPRWPGMLAGAAVVTLVVGVVPAVAGEYWLSAILVPFLILSLAAMGLNLLTGCAGQLSVGTAAYMAVGAYTSYNVASRLPGMPLLAAFAAGGLAAALLGIVAGLPSSRIKGFYL